jgi:hypothetical protein
VAERNGKIQNKVNERIRKASKFYHFIKSILWNRHRKCKTTIYRVYFKMTLLYGEETWMCTKREEIKIQATEIKFLRAILGKTMRDNQMHTSKSSERRIYRMKSREME